MLCWLQRCWLAWLGPSRLQMQLRRTGEAHCYGGEDSMLHTALQATRDSFREMARLLCSAPGKRAMACLWAAVWRLKALCRRWQSQLAVATQAR